MLLFGLRLCFGKEARKVGTSPGPLSTLIAPWRLLTIRKRRRAPFRSFPYFPGREEGLEDPLHYVGRHAFARILYRNLYVLPCPHISIEDRRVRLKVCVLKVYLYSPSVLTHGQYRVGREVHEDLLHLHGGRNDHVRCRGDPVRNGDGGRNRSPKEVDGLLYKGGQGEGAPLVLGLPTEGEDLLDQFSGPHGRLQYILKVLLHMGPVFYILNGHFRKTQYRCKNVVEVVGDASGQGSYGLHFLRVAELLLCPSQIAHVPRGREDADDFACVVIIDRGVVEYGRGVPVPVTDLRG